MASAAPEPKARLHRSYGRWLRPALLAPALSGWIYVTLAVFFFGERDPLLGGPLSNWVLAMLFCTAGALVQSAVLLVVDLVLAATALRRLATGADAWASATAAAILTGVSWHLWRPGDHGEAALFVFVAIAPMVVSAIAMRWLFGDRPR